MVYEKIALFVFFVLLSFSALLILSKSEVTANEKNEIEALTFLWTNAHENCQRETNPEINTIKCNAKLKLSVILQSLGLCEGIKILKYKEFKNQADPKYRDQSELFESLVREKWFPCIYSDIIKDKTRAINRDEISKIPDVIEISQGRSIKLNVNKLVYMYEIYDLNCRGGGGNEEETWDNCDKREEIYPYILDAGLCQAEYNYPESMKDVGTPYVWPFRRKWVPCHYYSLTNFDYRPESD
jgi:hypothetical protein